MKNSLWVKFKSNIQGSLILESALVLPLFIALLLVMICLSVLMVEFNKQQFVQLTAVERASFIWDEYDRDFDTGIRQSSFRYNVYENDQVLNMLGGLLQLNKSDKAHSIPINAQHNIASSKGTLWKDKLSLANHYVTSGNIAHNGILSFEKRLLSRVDIDFSRQNFLTGNDYQMFSSALISDATQHIRGVDLLIYYANKLSELKTNRNQWLSKAKSALPSS